MTIEKVINNNVVVVIENGKEAVIMGRGIGFQKKKGDPLEEDKVTKRFLPEKNHFQKRWRG